ncbi:cobalt-precorrin 5A acetaldehyde-lyase [Selenomonas ruminantium]|uniref:Cobalt-precorrin 5A acetaldehyde-lyase n=1 Tax=Selenomonas ruminantium TaxID=971 RepID=A0A1I3FCJ4_SELRU|nr:cobalamin biosynthesis protein [Selenomonas ruminantium]MBQ1889873.1 cobalamin biosynthesis protein [Selenomonas sp.]SFI08907.1 cobalt-precorrin 5A acetaldehyde-lyase [Selenomonas ruminantium]
MRLAAFALTAKAYELAKTFQRSLDNPMTVYVSAKVAPPTVAAETGAGIKTFAKLEEAVAETFTAYDGLVFIMAAGIVVRTIAPLLQDKLQDPAVVVFDERGQHGISLLSGHIGGANVLTQQLCQAVGASPVITTATDVNQCQAPDALAAKLCLRPWPKVRIRTLNSAVLEGQEVCWRIDKTLPHSVFYKRQLEQAGQTAELCVTSQCLQFCAEEKDRPWAVILSEPNLPALPELPQNVLCLTPRRLIAGVGCRRGTPAALVMGALDMACRMIGRDRSFIDALASTVVKRHEAGILFAADSLARPVHFYDHAQLQAMIARYQLEESDFVKENIGIGNVCEAAAYCCVGEAGGRLALRKTKFEKVTVALVWEK